MVALTTTNIPLITRAKFQVPIRTKRVYIHIRMIRPFMDIIHSILGRLKMAETGVVKAPSLSTSQACIWQQQALAQLAMGYTRLCGWKKGLSGDLFDCWCGLLWLRNC